jgi:hypothetical protein
MRKERVESLEYEEMNPVTPKRIQIKERKIHDRVGEKICENMEYSV